MLQGIMEDDVEDDVEDDETPWIASAALGLQVKALKGRIMIPCVP